MSIEQLLFFFILVALPLLERLIRTIRTRSRDSAAERARAAEAAVSGSRSPQSHDAIAAAADGRQTELLPVVPPLPPATPQAVRETVAELPRPTEGAQRRRRVDGDLRRAVVMIAILGPCRAFAPKDASQLNQ